MTEKAKDAFRGAGRVAFLAREKEIKEMIEAGHPTKNVYRKYGDKLNISYGQFARYVNKFIRRKQDGSEGENAGQAAGKIANPIDKETKHTRYKHDATKGNKRNDLV